MLIILSTHPIQYQVPLWRALAAEGSVPFAVWYMSDHGAKAGLDVEFGKTFAWDIDMLSGYPHRFLEGSDAVHPANAWQCLLHGSFAQQLEKAGATSLWIQGWQVMGYWQAAFAARSAGVQLWLRGESNDLAPQPAAAKALLKKLLLGALFNRVDHFLCIGSANKRLYQRYGAESSRLHDAPYCVDNERFAAQAHTLRPTRAEIRRQFGVPSDSFCVLFCGKFIGKKHPSDLITAATELTSRQGVSVHLLFAGSGELGPELRSGCEVLYDAESSMTTPPAEQPQKPTASFLGFLNQTEVSRAYVAADCLVLPSDYGETWGLVVNEAMASGLLCIISDRCGSAHDLGRMSPNLVFPFGDTSALASALHSVVQMTPEERCSPLEHLANHSFHRAVQTVTTLAKGA